MRIRGSRVICVLFGTTMLMAVQSTLVRAQDDSSVEPPPSESSLSDRAREFIETVMEHHIDPPTRQQMILEVLRGVAAATSQQLPPDLSTRISSISDIEALYELLERELSRVVIAEQPIGEINAAVLQRIRLIVPGGVEIVQTRDYKVNEQLAANRYVGIGVHVGMDKEAQRLNFTKIIEGSPAEKAGLLANDLLESVDGKDTLKVPIEEVVQWLRGPEDSVVKLTVRSAGAEPRELEIVRRVVPMQTLTLIPQEDNSTATLIRLERVSASSVHEIRRILDGLPAEVTTIIVDLRFTLDGSLHQLHVLADALLEEGHLGNIETRSGMRSVNAEAGTILQGRKAVLVYATGHSEQLDWLAAVAQEKGISVYRDQFRQDASENEFEVLPQPVREFLPTSDGMHYVGVATSRLLKADGKRLDRANPAGIPIQPISTTALIVNQLTQLAGVKVETTPPAVTAATPIEGYVAQEPGKKEIRIPNAPAADKTLIDQIMSNTNDN